MLPTNIFLQEIYWRRSFLGSPFMTYLNAILLVIALFTLTCVLCVIIGALLQFNPLLTVLFLFLGTLGVVLMVDILQAFLSG